MRILTTAIAAEEDVVICRRRARSLAALLGFPTQDQTRIATAVSELARNIVEYAGSGRVEFFLEGEQARQLFIVRLVDKGPGIPDLALVLSGKYKSSTGMGLGIVGARRLMDQFQIESAEGKGTRILLKKLLPREAPYITGSELDALVTKLQSADSAATINELHLQNRELLATLDELKSRQEELLQLTRELEDTNRGVVALYAELDEKADRLRRADEMKSRFLSNMSHEFRTPLNSIRALSKLLLDRVDGELSGEQEKQVNFILKSAESLSELVNDLLDLAKIEAGKIDLYRSPFDVNELFSALRGMLRPLLVSESVRLEFEEVPQGLVLSTDEGKVSQILRNFISNALKFTERGEVRVGCSVSADGQRVTLWVRDTGVGIAAENQELIFEEFAQVENPMQRRFQGTGLGLPLCRKLAALLGGTIKLESESGAGSTFAVEIPVTLPLQPREEVLADVAQSKKPDGIPVLLVEDHAETTLLYEKYLEGTPYWLLTARSLEEAEELLKQSEPKAIVLDILLNRQDSWHWLAKIKSDPSRMGIPLIVASDVDDRQKGFALGADAYFVKPLLRKDLLSALGSCLGKGQAARASARETPLEGGYGKRRHAGWNRLDRA